MKFGIDAIGFYTPPFYLDLEDLAAARDIARDKIIKGLGQKKMAIPSPDEDSVTMAAEAGRKAFEFSSKEDIDLFLFATETGVDHSKSAGIFVHKLLDLSSECRVIELKQACYSGTVGMQLALNYLRCHPTKKVLLITSDIARYGLNTPGESSQGAGAIALILSCNPRIIAIEPECSFYTEDVMDFWRPNDQDEAIVDGRYSCEIYLKVLKKVWNRYCQTSNRQFQDHQHFCYHVPIPKLAAKAHHYLADSSQSLPPYTLEQTLLYTREIGNCYTASLFLSVLSLLENTQQSLSQDRIGFYSYGSGCSGEFFSGIVQDNYHLLLHDQWAMLNNRQRLTPEEYENFYTFSHQNNTRLPVYKKNGFRFCGIEKYKRYYTPLT